MSESASLEQCLDGINKINGKIDGLVELIDGEPKKDIPGIRPRLARVEQRLDAIPQDLSKQLEAMAAQLKTITDDMNAQKLRRDGVMTVARFFQVTSIGGVMVIVMAVLKYLGVL